MCLKSICKSTTPLLFIIPLLILFYSCKDDEWIVKGANITRFSFSKDLNNLDYDIIGEVNHKYRTITLTSDRWIENLSHLVPTIEGTGNFYVDNELQESEITPKDFSNREIIYKVKGENGEEVLYRVILLSPQTTGLPIIRIDIEGGKEVVEKTKEYLKTNLTLIDTQNPKFSFSSTAGIRGRGNSTWEFYDKKPYRIKFDERVSLFGHKKAKSWVLLANYIDPTLLMNSIAFELGKRLELEHTNHGHSVELMINGTHRGTYLLTEQIQEDKNRINIDEETGFLIEMDEYFDEDFRFRSKHYQLPIMLKDPENDKTFSSVKKFFTKLEEELFKDFTTKNKYKDYVDINSLINFMLVNELTANREIEYPKSAYAYKKTADEKLFFGPIWDFDWGYGKDAKKTFNYFYSYKVIFKPNTKASKPGEAFFCRFLDDPDFRKAYQNRWNQLKSSGLLNMDDFITEEANKLEYSQQLNFSIWPNKKNYQEQIRLMRKWMIERVQTLDKEINSWN